MIAGMVQRTFLIAGNTFREALRQRLVALLVLLTAGLVASARFFRQFDFGPSELKFIADFGFGGILFFGSLLAIAATAQLFFSEIENRTALTLLAKPVRRWEFLAGKFLGTWLVLAAFVALAGGVLVALLGARHAEMVALDPSLAGAPAPFSYGGLVLFLGLQTVRLGVLAALTLFVATYARTNLFTVGTAFFALVICQLQYLAQDHWQESGGAFAKAGAWLLARAFPNLQVFNAAEALVFGDQAGTGLAVQIGGYGLGYILVFLALASWSFRHREV